MIAIIDYGAGNIESVRKAFEFIGAEAVLTSDPEVLKNADAAVLPGVGSFGDAMDNIKKRNLLNPIKEFAASGKPFLGICLGLQILFESSEESEGVEGLGILKGKIVRIPASEGLKIPHMGWNSLEFEKEGDIFEGLENGTYVYFVHSYYLKCEEDIVSTTAEYGVKIHASVHKNNIRACQFHPEKSGSAGLKILKNFVSLIGEGK
ncbi:MAG: imidazole glycerol phosphate synthase subunit HisH [Ruminococcaceae bacterium]|nr:imidazole glycerol phosphate synthase subunit HisH [Oscillospiraceae bacterium]